MRSCRPLLALCGICLWTAVQAGAVYVDGANDSGTEDGTAEFPYDTVQEGINNAVFGDRVVVASGGYKETLLMRDGISVVGAGAQSTFIDGTGIPNSVVIFDATNGSPLLTGFTITGGRGDQRTDVGGLPVTTGGGILILNSSPEIRRNVITGNVVDDGYCLGGGIYIDAQGAAPVIEENIIAGNVALSLTVAGSGQGGAIYVTAKNGGVTIRSNRIEDNLAFDGGGVNLELFSGASATLERNSLENNEAVSGAGAYLSVPGDSTTTVVNNLFRANGSEDPAAAGGGLYGRASGTGVITIVNNTFVGQLVPLGSGGGLALDDTGSTAASLAANNIFAGNTAATGGAIDHTAFAGTIRRNDFHANAGGDLYDAGGSAAVIVDNLYVDPQFMAGANNDRLQPTSPLIDTAEEADAPTEDLEGFARPFDGDGDGIVHSDFGAHEFPQREVTGLLFSSPTQVQWEVLSLQEGFHLYRGNLERLRQTGEYIQDPSNEPSAAHFCGLTPAEVPFDDPFAPAAGEVVFYLVSLTIGDFEGSLGSAPIGFPRANPNRCP